MRNSTAMTHEDTDNETNTAAIAAEISRVAMLGAMRLAIAAMTTVALNAKAEGANSQITSSPLGLREQAAEVPHVLLG